MAITLKRKSLKKTSKKNVQSRKRINKTRKNMKTVRNMRGGGKSGKSKKVKTLPGLDHVTVKMPPSVFKHIPKAALDNYITIKTNAKEKGNTDARTLTAEYEPEKKTYTYFSVDGEKKSIVGKSNEVNKAVYHHVSKSDLHEAFKKVLSSNNSKKSYEALKKTEEFQNIKSAVDAALIKASLESEPLDSRAIEKIIKETQAKMVYDAIIHGQGKEPLNQSKKALQGHKSNQIFTELELPPPLQPRGLTRTQQTILPKVSLTQVNPYVNSHVGKNLMFMNLLAKNKIPINTEIFSNLMDYLDDKGINSENIDANRSNIIKQIERLEKSQADLPLLNFVKNLPSNLPTRLSLIPPYNESTVNNGSYRQEWNPQVIKKVSSRKQFPPGTQIGYNKKG